MKREVEMKKYLSLFLVSLVLQGCVTLGTEQPANALNDSKVVVRGIETAASDYKSGPTTLVVLFPGGSGQLGLAEQSTKVTSYLTDNFWCDLGICF